MVDYIFEKTYFGRDFRFYQVDVKEKIDVKKLQTKGVDSLIAFINEEKKIYKNIENISTFSTARGLSLYGNYDELDDLSKFKSLEYLSIDVLCKKEIPFRDLDNLWHINLNYDKKTCSQIFECKALEYIYIDNYKELDTSTFENFIKAKNISLRKANFTEFSIENMSNLEHFSLGYNTKIQDISFLKDASLKSVGFANCKNVKNWEILGTLKNLEALYLENIKDIPSLDFLFGLNHLKTIRITGDVKVLDGQIKNILQRPNLEDFFIPIRKEYDISFEEYTEWKERI